jgi:hypothetical protein
MEDYSLGFSLWRNACTTRPGEFGRRSRHDCSSNRIGGRAGDVASSEESVDEQVVCLETCQPSAKLHPRLGRIVVGGYALAHQAKHHHMAPSRASHDQQRRRNRCGFRDSRAKFHSRNIGIAIIRDLERLSRILCSECYISGETELFCAPATNGCLSRT